MYSTHFLIVLLFCSVLETEQCLQTIPPEEVFFPSTEFNWPSSTEMMPSSTGAANLCDSCDINDLLIPQGGDKRVPNEIEEMDPVNGCKQTFVRCFDIDITFCDSVILYAVTATATTAVGIETRIAAEATFSCAEDGSYSFDDVKEIEALYCIFDNCI